MTIPRKEYREMRQRIKIKKMSGSYVVVWPVTVGDQTLFSYSKEKVVSPAIGFNAYAKARRFAKNIALLMCSSPEHFEGAQK